MIEHNENIDDTEIAKFEDVPKRDWAGRTTDEAFPMSLSVKE